MKVKFVYSVMENKDNGYCVIKYRVVETGKQETFIGYFLPQDKFTYDFVVKEVIHPTYGKQYYVESYETILSDNREEIIDYIAVSYKGIGKKTAEKIYAKYENSSIDIIENDTEALLYIKGISPKKVEIIKESLKEKKINKELYMFLIKYGFSAKQIQIASSIWHESALERVKENPYILCCIRGIDFDKADKLREACNISLFDDERVYAACVQSIKDCMLEGNCGADRKELTRRLYMRLSLPYSFVSCEKNLWSLIVKFIKEEKLAYRKVMDNNEIKQYVYLNFMEEAERTLAHNIVKLLHNEKTIIPDIDAKIKKKEKYFGIKLDDSQIYAVKTILEEPISVLEGGPGSGKTTITLFVKEIYHEEFPDKPLEFMAPTGRAARILTEKSGELASTIHSRFKLKASENNEYEDAYASEEVILITDGLVCCDECSMVGLMLMNTLFKNIENKNGTVKVVLVGDRNQLESVEPGRVFAHIIDSGVVPVVTLKYKHRQEADNSVICENADNMQAGITTLKNGDDFVCNYLEDEESCPKQLIDQLKVIEYKIVSEYVSFYKDDAYKDVVALCPYKDYPCGVYSVNRKIQEILNPLNGRYEMSGLHNLTFREGDIVMHLKNDGDVLNGDIGIVRYIGKESEDDNYLTMYVDYDNGSSTIEYVYTKDNIDKVTLAYAMTVHKAQGGEYDAVISLLTEFHDKMLMRNLLYTTVTRARKMVSFHTFRKVVATAISNATLKPRNSLLCYNISQMYYDEGKQMKLFQ